MNETVETCEIQCALDGFLGGKSYFVAKASGIRGLYITATSSTQFVATEMFRGTELGVVPKEDEKSSQALSEIMSLLATQGWKQTGKGRGWWEYRYQRVAHTSQTPAPFIALSITGYKHKVALRRLIITLCLVLLLIIGGVVYGIVTYVNHLPRSNLATLYQENGSDNWSGWKGSPDWKVKNGLLMNDGSAPGSNCGFADPSMVAPTTITVANFAIEVKIQVISLGNNFGITVGGFYDNSGGQGEGWNVFNGYAVESSDNGPDVCNAHAPGTGQPVQFDPGTSWHIYRMEVTGQHGKLFVDNHFITESDHLDWFAGKVGLFCGDTQLNISSFTVYAI